MLLKPVRAGRTAQRLALVPRLSARLATRLATKALCATLRRRLLQTVARRRLAAVAAVQTETTLQFPYPLPKPRGLLPKTRRSAPEATRSPTQDARSSVRKSRTRAPSTGQTVRNDSWQRLTHFSFPRVNPINKSDILGSYDKT